MKKTLAFLLLLGLMPLLSTPAPAQDQEPDPEEVEAIDEALTELEAAIKDKASVDQIQFIKILSEKWKNATPKQRKKAFKLAGKNLKSKEKNVLEATVAALGAMGGGKKGKDAKTATKILLTLLKKKSIEQDVQMFLKVMDSVGRLQSAKGADELLSLLNHKSNEVIAGSLDALRHFKDAPFKTRKELVKEILKVYLGTFGQSRNPRNFTAQRKLRDIELQAEAALAALTNRADIKGAIAWQKWWNKEGKKANKGW